MHKSFLTLAGLVAVLALAAVVWGVPPEQGGESQADAKYLGQKVCKKCHMKQHRSWKKMKHFNAWDNLPEDKRDPSQKDDQGRACISCHTTGYGLVEKDGFVDATKSAHLTGVQCEACHGPGSKHVEKTKAMAKEKRKKFNEGEEKFIVRKTTACSDCHNPHLSYKKKYGTGE